MNLLKSFFHPNFFASKVKLFQIITFIFSATLPSCAEPTALKDYLQKEIQEDGDVRSSKRSTRSGIVGGTEVNDSHDFKKHIVFIYDNDKEYICTGTIIGKNTILTAAHCLSKKSSYTLVFHNRPYDVLFENKVANKDKYIRYSINTVIHKDFINGSNAPYMNQFDIGLIYFSDKLPEGFEPAAVALNEDLIKKNTSVILAGYGVSKVVIHDIRYKKNKKFNDKLKTGEYYCDFDILDANGNPTCVSIDMSGDGILRFTTGTIKSIFSSEFITTDKSSSTCAGDSGGPAFVKHEGLYYVIGVTSRGSFSCEDEGIYTSVSSHIDWLIEN